MINMENAAGSADKEMGIVEQSIDYKVNKLTQTWVGFIQGLAKRESIGSIVDTLTQLSDLIIKLTDNIGVFGVAFTGAITTAIVKKDGVIEAFRGINDSLFNVQTFATIKGDKKKTLFNQYDIDALNAFNVEFEKLYKEMPLAEARNMALANTMDDNVNPALKTLARNCDETGLQIKKTTQDTKFAIGAMNLLKSAISMAAAALIGYAITKGFQAFSDKLHETENNIKALTEATENYKQSSSEIDEQIKKYQELNKKLSSTVLSAEEYEEVKSDLITVQNNLNDAYGREAEKLDLVNGKYDEQYAKILRNNKAKAADFYNDSDNRKAYESAKKSQEAKTKNYTITTNLDSEEVAKYQDIVGILKNNGINVIEGMSGKTYYQDINGKATGSIDVRELSDRINTIVSQIENKYGADSSKRSADVNQFINGLLQWRTGLLKDYEDNIELMKYYSLQGIYKDEDISNAYSDLENAIDEFNKSDLSGDDLADAVEKVEEAKQNLALYKDDILEFDLIVSDLEDKLNKQNVFNYLWNSDISDNLLKDFDKSLFTGLTDADLESQATDDLNSLIGKIISVYELPSDYKGFLINKLLEEGLILDAQVEQNKNVISELIGDYLGQYYNDVDTDDLAKKIFSSYTKDELKQLIENEDIDFQGILKEAANKLGRKVKYDELVEEFTSQFPDIDITQTLFGNVDLDDPNRIIRWNPTTIAKYQNILSDWGLQDVQNGDISTVLGSQGEFEVEDQIFDIAFTPVLLKDDGTTDLLSEDVVNGYIFTVLDKALADGKWTTDEILQIDAEGLVFNGQLTKGLIANIGSDSGQVSEAMHYLGVNGAIALATGIKDEIDNLFGGKSIFSWITGKVADKKTEIAVDSDPFLKYSDTVHKMMDLSNVGKLDEDHMKSLEGYKELLGDVGGEVDDLIKKIQELEKGSTNPQLDSVVDMATVEGGLDSLNTVYQSRMYDSKHLVSGSDLSGLFDQFGDLPIDTLNTFIAAMQDMNYEAGKSQEAFDDLATAYLDAKYPIDNLVEANEQWTAQMLQNEGVENAEYAVHQRLVAIEEVRTNALNELNDAVEASGGKQSALYKLMQTQGISTTEDLANATADEITAMINAAEASGVETSGLKQLLASKKDAQAYNYTGDVDALLEEAHAAGVNSTAYYILANMKAYGNIADANVKQQYIEKLRNDVQTELNKFKIELPEYNYRPKNQNTNTNGNGNTGTESTQDPQTYDWIEVKITRLTEAIEQLNKVSSNTFEGWTNRTQKLNDEFDVTLTKIENMEKGSAYYKDYANKIYEKNKAILDSGDYITKIQKGLIHIDEITDETLRKAIDDYKTWWDKAVALDNQIYETKKRLSEISKQKFDNIATQFESIATSIQNVNTELETLRGNLEKQGRKSTKAFYEAEKITKQDELAQKKQERDQLYKSLKESLANGTITYGTEEYNNMIQKIQNVDNEILTLNGDILELDNNIRQTNWDNFDLARTKVSEVIDEVEFLAGLLGNETLTDGMLNTGLNKYGNAQMSMYASNYNLYMEQAKAYKDEIDKLNAEIAKDPTNQDLLDRRSALIKSQQEAINSANSEKKAMIDLARSGYDAVLSKMQELIDAKKELLNTEKETYEYQKTLAEKNKALASLYKQQAVYANDTSEEGRKRLQQLKQSIDQAETDLKQTEYDKYISDQEKLMDKMYEEFSEFIDEMFEDTDALIEKLIQTVNETSESNKNTIAEVTEKVGYNIQTQLAQLFTPGITDVSTISNGVVHIWTGIDNIVKSVQKIVDEIVSDSETKSAQGVAQVTNNPVNGMATGTLKSYIDSMYLSDTYKKSMMDMFHNNGYTELDSADEAFKALYSGSFDKTSSSMIPTLLSLYMNSLGYWIDHLALSDVDKAQLHKDFAAVGAKDTDDANVVYAGYAAGTLPKSQSDDPEIRNILDKDIPSILNRVGSYAVGVKHLGDELGWTNENGKGEIIRKSDGAILTPIGKGGTVFTNAMSDVLWDFAKNPSQFLDSFSVKAPSVQSANISQAMQLNIGTINLPNVTKPEEFSSGLIAALKNDGNVVSAIQSVTVDRLMGSNKKKINTF